MSELSKRMRESRAKATRGIFQSFQTGPNATTGWPSYGVNAPDIDGDLSTIADLMMREDSEFFAASANEIGNLCDEIEALEKEVARLRGQRHE